MPLRPLSQWICDTCGQIIESPEHGYLQWYHDAHHKSYNFQIVHHWDSSPINHGRRCYIDNSVHRVRDVHLSDHTGPNLIPWLLKFLDVGPFHDSDYSGPWVQNIREYVELFRRLCIPYYEEARRYWSKASEDGIFNSANESWPYLPDNLLALINRYGED